MQKISITGGKGGTGKSTYATLLAQRLIKKGHKVALCDCDVECPNDYLLLGKKLNYKVKVSYAQFPTLDKSKCRKCGLCAQVCKENAIFAPVGEYPKFFPNLCSGCGACWSVCPYGAIKPHSVSIGEVFLNKISSDFYLVTGSAHPAREETSPVVQDTRQYALQLAGQEKIDYLLLDSPAGTHCTVIRTLLGSDISYVVTEPTPLGAYNLEGILKLLDKLGVEPKVVLNRADLGKKQEIKNISENFETKIVEEIPYSEELVRAYSKGELLGFSL